MLFHFLEDAAHVELHAADEWHFEYKCAHEVIEYLAPFLLQVNRLVLFQISEQLVMRHGEFHHAVYLSFQFLLIALFEGAQIIVFFCKFAHIFLL